MLVVFYQHLFDTATIKECLKLKQNFLKERFLNVVDVNNLELNFVVISLLAEQSCVYFRTYYVSNDLVTRKAET